MRRYAGLIGAAMCLIIMMFTPYAAAEWEEIDGESYYFGDDGEKLTGWQIIDGDTYYFRADGRMLTGWAEIGGVRYLFDNFGVMTTGNAIMNGSEYYFNDDGSMFTGWFTATNGNKYYYGSDGKMRKDTKVRINGIVYTFDEYGRLTGQSSSSGKSTAAKKVKKKYTLSDIEYGMSAAEVKEILDSCNAEYETETNDSGTVLFTVTDYDLKAARVYAVRTSDGLAMQFIFFAKTSVLTLMDYLNEQGYSIYIFRYVDGDAVYVYENGSIVEVLGSTKIGKNTFTVWIELSPTLSYKFLNENYYVAYNYTAEVWSLL